MEEIRSILKSKREYEAEYVYLDNFLKNMKQESTVKQQERFLFLKARLTCIESWMALLPEDEALVTKRHLIDGIDIPRIVIEYQERWGIEFGKTERTIKMYQRRALQRIMAFEEKKKNLLE